MIVIASYPDGPKAHVDRLRLEGLGIHVEVLDENTVTMDPLWGPAVGGVKLCVAEDDREQAEEVLDSIGRGREISCPHCQSTDIRICFHWVWLNLCIFSVPIGPVRRRMVCRACTHAWRSD